MERLLAKKSTLPLRSTIAAVLGMLSAHAATLPVHANQNNFNPIFTAQVDSIDKAVGKFFRQDARARAFADTLKKESERAAFINPLALAIIEVAKKKRVSPTEALQYTDLIAKRTMESLREAQLQAPAFFPFSEEQLKEINTIIQDFLFSALPES